MLNDTMNSRGPRSLSRIDALFRSVHWLSAGRSALHVQHQSQVAASPAVPAPELRAQNAALFESLGFSCEDPACAGIGRPGARADQATARISDWLSYLPRDCVKAMVKDGWHWTT